MTGLNYIEREGQHVITWHIVENKRCGVWAGMGFGKTAATLEAIETLKLIDEVKMPVLVLGSLRIAQSVWPDEVQKWKQFSHLKVSVITGSEKERRLAIIRKADIYTVNYENIPWLMDELKRLGKAWPFEMVVADESTKLKGFRLKTKKAKRSRALAQVAHSKIKRFVELTGTPSPNGLKDLWGQSWFLDGGMSLGRTYTAFMQRWFQRDFDGYGVTALPHAQRQIEGSLAGLCISLNPQDYFDLKEPIKNIIRVKIDAEARKIYRDMEKEMFTEIETLVKTHQIEAVNAAAKTMKCLQLANGAAYVQKGSNEFVEIHKAKLEALEDVIEEAAGMPVLVAYHFKSDLARLKKHFKNGRALDKNPQTIRDWNAGKIPVLFAHPASAGHGLNLQDGGNIITFFSLNWNLEEHLQIIERIGAVRQFQAGHDRPTYIYYIVVENTIEEAVLDRLENKKTIQDVLMEAMKHRKVIK